MRAYVNKAKNDVGYLKVMTSKYFTILIKIIIKLKCFREKKDIKWAYIQLLYNQDSDP